MLSQKLSDSKEKGFKFPPDREKVVRDQHEDGVELQSIIKQVRMVSKFREIKAWIVTEQIFPWIWKGWLLNQFFMKFLLSSWYLIWFCLFIYVKMKVQKTEIFMKVSQN